MTTIILADDHHIVREGVRALLRSIPDWTIVGEAADGLKVLELVQKNEPDVLILDLGMPGIDGLEVIRRLREGCHHTRIVVLSAHDAQDYVAQAMENGAMAYVVKYSTREVLIQAIRAVLEGRHFYGPPITQDAIDQYRLQTRSLTSGPVETLTTREHEVMRLALQGLTNAEIADRLSVSVTTIATHRANLLQKLGLHSQTELVRYAYSHGLLPTDD